MIPRLRLPEEILKIIPTEISEYAKNFQQWAVMKDGEEH